MQRRIGRWGAALTAITAIALAGCAPGSQVAGSSSGGGTRPTCS